MHHRKKGEMVACFFPAEAEEKYVMNRSVDNFIKSYLEFKKEEKDIQEEISK